MIWSCTSCTWERFAPEGTFAGATARLPALRDLGVTAIELMPVADFPGERNWGYDGVCLYAPSRAYGRPDDLRRLVDRAHALGISVVLDVVYNHLGPEGAYLPEFYPAYFTDRHSTPWGRALNLDDRGADIVRRLVTDNASYWIREYHFDGLRLDATHALVEDDSGAIVREIVHAARAASSRPVFIHAEDHRNLAAMLEDPAEGGWGVDGVWADDFHHVIRRLLAGDEHAYYSDLRGNDRRSWPGRSARDGSSPGSRRHTWARCAARIRRGSRCDALSSAFRTTTRSGTAQWATGCTPVISPDAWRAASVVLLTAPMTPLLFMGQEWAADTPFQYFTDLEPGLGQLVTEGRRREFASFPEFSNEDARDRIPDPQSPATHADSHLDWSEAREPAHARGPRALSGAAGAAARSAGARRQRPHVGRCRGAG